MMKKFIKKFLYFNLLGLFIYIIIELSVPSTFSTFRVWEVLIAKHYPFKIGSFYPNEEIYIEIDRATIYLEGMQWCYVDIEPKNNNHLFITYQYDANHKRIVRYSDYEDDNNKWMDHMYIQKKMELLQSRTNQYILLLTMITVWESVFGIKNTLKNMAFISSSLFNWIAGGIEWLGKLL